MSNATLAVHLDDKPFDLKVLAESLESQLGSVFKPTSTPGDWVAHIELGDDRVLFRVEDRNFSMDNRAVGERWNAFVKVCLDYSRRTESRMAIFDAEYNYCACIDPTSTVDQILQAVAADPFEGERVWREYRESHGISDPPATQS